MTERQCVTHFVPAGVHGSVSSYASPPTCHDPLRPNHVQILRHTTSRAIMQKRKFGHTGGRTNNFAMMFAPIQ